MGARRRPALLPHRRALLLTSIKIASKHLLAQFLDDENAAVGTHSGYEAAERSDLASPARCPGRPLIIDGHLAEHVEGVPEDRPVHSRGHMACAPEDLPINRVPELIVFASVASR